MQPLVGCWESTEEEGSGGGQRTEGIHSGWWVALLVEHILGPHKAVGSIPAPDKPTSGFLERSDQVPFHTLPLCGILVFWFQALGISVPLVF